MERIIRVTCLVLITIYSIILFGSILKYFSLRSCQNVQALSVDISVYVGVATLGLLDAIFAREFFGMPCAYVVWIGNLLFSSIVIMQIVQLWRLIVLSEPSLRQTFARNLSPKFALFALFTAIIFSAFLTALILNFDTRYVQFFEHNRCQFLNPPFFACLFFPFLLIGFLMSFRLKKAKLNQRSERNTHVISFNETSSCIIILYFCYLAISDIPVVNSTCNRFKPSILLFASLFINANTSIVLPLLQAFFKTRRKGAKRSGYSSTQRRIGQARISFQKTTRKSATPQNIRLVKVSQRPPRMVFESMDIHQILVNTHTTQMFRKHAEDAMCVESVDFYVAVIEYRSLLSNESDLEYDPPAHEIELLWNGFNSIITQFIDEDSPSEINISCNNKRWLLQFKIETAFKSLTYREMVSVFDKPLQEIEVLLTTNLLATFLKMLRQLSPLE